MRGRAVVLAAAIVMAPPSADLVVCFQKGFYGRRSWGIKSIGVSLALSLAYSIGSYLYHRHRPGAGHRRRSRGDGVVVWCDLSDDLVLKQWFGDAVQDSL